MTDKTLHLTDKKPRSTRRALLRFLRHCDYGFRDIAIEISDIIRRSPISFSCSVAAIVARLAENGFEFVAMCDRRAMRILSQIADEYFRRSGTTAGAPFVSVLPLTALRVAIGSSKALKTQSSHSPCLPRSPDYKYAQTVRTKKPRRRLLFSTVMYPDPGSNRDGSPHRCLRPARLPIPPSGLMMLQR